MKRFLALFIILIIILIGLLEQMYVVKTLDKLIEGIESVNSVIDDPELSKQKFDEVMQWWNVERDYLEAFVSHNDTREINYRLSELQGAIDAKNTQDAIALCTTVIEVTEHTKHILEFSWDQVL